MIDKFTYFVLITRSIIFSMVGKYCSMPTSDVLFVIGITIPKNIRLSHHYYLFVMNNNTIQCEQK